MASSGPYVAGARAVDEGDGQIAHRRQNVWSVSGAQAGAIFAKADIAPIMGAIFDTPMPAVQF